MPSTDEQLMLAYAGGDAASFEALYGRHKGALYRFMLRSVRDRAQADELFQDVWMKVIEARGRYAPKAKFGTWLYTIAHNRLVDHWRAKGLAVVSLDDEDSGLAEPAAPPGSDPQRTVAGRQALARLAEGIAALPFAQREAFLLHCEAGLTAAQIAEATGTNPEAAKSRLRYALRKLEESLADD